MNVTCQSCGAINSNCTEDSSKIFRLRPIPPVDLFQTDKVKAEEIPLHDLAVFKCRDCGLIQIESSPPANCFYDNYIYTSSSSPDMEKNFEDLAQSLQSLISAKMNDDLKILDIGCNDGLLLKKIHNYFPNAHLYGTDPSPVALSQVSNFYTLHHEYFPGKKTTENGPYDIIIGTNSLAHIPNIGDCFEAISSLLKPNGILIVEVSDISEMAKKKAWDYIYHEHLYYYSNSTLSNILLKKGLATIRTDLIETKGGSIRLFAEKNSTSANKFAQNNYQDDLALLNNCYQEALKNYSSLEDYVLKHNSRLFGYGACATASVAIAQHTLFQNIISIFDDNDKRQGLYSPHFAIPVQNIEDYIFNENDVIVVFAWRFIDAISRKIHNYCENNNAPVPHIINSMHPCLKHFNG